jgi:hypothetical protein
MTGKMKFVEVHRPVVWNGCLVAIFEVPEDTTEEEVIRFAQSQPDDLFRLRKPDSYEELDGAEARETPLGICGNYIRSERGEEDLALSGKFRQWKKGFHGASGDIHTGNVEVAMSPGEYPTKKRSNIINEAFKINYGIKR